MLKSAWHLIRHRALGRRSGCAELILFSTPMLILGNSTFSNGRAPPRICSFGTTHVWLGGDELDSSNASSNASLSDFPKGTNLAEYHTYGALMTPTTTTWYFDNKEMNTYPTYPAFLTQPMYLMLGDQMGCNGYGSCPSGTPKSLNMTVQWVHVFQLKP
jgi:hypothetical protein